MAITQQDKKLSSKEKYWMRRNQDRVLTGIIGEHMVERGGKRGQGERPTREVAHTKFHFDGQSLQAETSKPVSKKAIRKNTKRARKAALREQA